MLFSSFQGFINELKYRNDIHVISEFVSPDLESTEINDRIIKNGDGKAILFNNNGTEFPLLLNMYGSEERMNLILGTQNMDEIGERIKRMMTEATKSGSSFFDQFSKLPMLKEIASWMPSRSKRKAICQQVIMQQVDLSSIPIPKCWPHDGGKFITLPMVHTLNPETGIGNVGMYRMQVLDNQTTGMHWHLHKDG
ncbi:MAG: UbiD family decarboxylase, partial [Bacteroidales bacterium]|nr:UbiD family decarboxylase [Bacteroidales bacterium]